MVKHTAEASVVTAGCASSSPSRNHQKATKRARAKDDVRRTQKGFMVKSKLRSRRRSHEGKWWRHNIFIPASELLNELPVRVREEVESIKGCCLPHFTGTYSGNHGDSESGVDNSNLHRHQLFSTDHAENLDPEIRQWLPRIVCPAFPLSIRCKGGNQPGDAMLRFQECFPGEYMFPRSSDPKPTLDEYRFLKMTFGQLEFLRNQLPRKALTPEMVEGILHSWRPIVRPGVEQVLLSEFPPVRMPSSFGSANHDSAELGHGGMLRYCDAHLNTNSLSATVVDEHMEDEPDLVYPELYLPPRLLSQTGDPAYIAAAVAAHEPMMEEETSPLVHVPFPPDTPQTCLEGAVPMDECDLGLFTPGEEVNCRWQGFHAQLQEMVVARSNQYFD
ncbi:hypothetical protein F5148DRAFT_1187467 [Russula earlei]|uniref:Uncharacterized protein n=1 Tax=Russula earlei TaxID=71964 RepID=A0ACC0UCY6_9AGAM|nr:hypothetical protein F5148DRAFT_1187467 [Russula earlei]